MAINPIRAILVSGEFLMFMHVFFSNWALNDKSMEQIHFNLYLTPEDVLYLDKGISIFHNSI